MWVGKWSQEDDRSPNRGIKDGGPPKAKRWPQTSEIILRKSKMVMFQGNFKRQVRSGEEFQGRIGE
jgi:hypothetical protein